MQTRLRQVILALVAVGAAGMAGAGTVQVSLNHPERFKDATDGPGPYPLASVQELTAYFQKLGQKYLPDEQNLSIEVLDLDLVGKLMPSHRSTSGWVRVARSPMDWPQARLRYKLIAANGQVLQSGEEAISDMGFASRIGVFGSDPLRYEKRMFRDWFRSRFVDKVVATQ